MHWIEGSGKVLSAVATLNGVAERRRRQRVHLKNVLQHFNMADSRPPKTPIELGA